MAHGIHASPRDLGKGIPADGTSVDQTAILGAVREDVRQTLRSGWIDASIEVAAAQPMFFTAAWSAIRPNVGRSFLYLAKALRSEAAAALAAVGHAPDLRKRLNGELGDEELRRIEDAVRASHQVTAKVELVVHALLRAVRRERISGTGREEPPVRRGVPEWQRWMSFQPAPEEAWPVLDDLIDTMALPGQPSSTRLLARWPVALTRVWDELEPLARSTGWPVAAQRVRRMVLAGISSLPHPVELQWTALKERGFSEEDRVALAETLAEHDSAMPQHTLIAAFAWSAFGSPEVGVEG
jgi:hypothetical protein